MRALLLILIASSALGQGRFDRFNQRTDQGRSTRGFQQSSLAFFEFAPTSGAGMGTACACTTPTGAKGEAMTFARASSAWCTRDDYSLVECSTNQPRVMTGRGAGEPLGLFVEELAAINSALHNRDGSHAIWTKTNATCTKTAIGVDGVASSATRCSATAANGTVTQAIVRAAADNATSLYIRRQTGTGAVEVTRDNGVTWTPITTRLTSSWKRVVCIDTEGCMGGRCIVVPDMCANSANPTIGIRIVTSGDAVDFDLAQNEAAIRPSSPITTAGVAATRAAETSPYLTMPVALPVLGSLSASVLTGRGTTSTAPLAVWESNTNFWLSWFTSSVVAEQSLGCAFRPPSGLVSVGSGSFHPGGGWGNVTCNTARQVCTSGQCATSAAGDAVTAQTRVYVGAGVLSGQPFQGIVSRVCVDGSASRCGPDRTTVSPNSILWLGDSITAGNVSSPTRPPYSLQLELSQRVNSTSRIVMNGGFGGDNAAAMLVRWNAYFATQGYSTLIFLGGVNDLRTGTSAATIYATIIQILDAARVRGMSVVVVSVTPWGNWAEWTAGRQTETLALNALLSAWATTNGQTYVDAYTALSAGGGTPEDLAAIYDSGDGLHPNAAGTTLLATTVGGGIP